MSTLKSKTLRGLAVAGVTVGIVAASSSAAFAQEIVVEGTVYIPTAVAVGANPMELTITPTAGNTVEGAAVTLTPDDPAVLDFNPTDGFCTDGDAGSISCTVPGTLPADGQLLTFNAVVADGATAESDLGFGVELWADAVEPSTLHTGLSIGSTNLVDNEAPEPTEPPTDEATEEPSDDATDAPTEADTSEAAAEETLPTTGNSTGIMIGAAAAIAVAGAGALIIARRRKTAAGWE